MFELEPEHRPIAPPQLDIEALPKEHRKRGQSVADNLEDLAAASLRYSQAVFATRICAVLLIGKMDKPEVIRNTAVSGWLAIAAEGAVLSARNYWKALEALDGLPGSIPGWRDRWNPDAFKAAKGEFETRFPLVDRMRHSIAHREYYSNPDKKMIPDGAPERAPRKLEDSFSAYFGGTPAECEVSENAAAFIVENVAKVFAAFEGLRPPETEGNAPQK